MLQPDEPILAVENIENLFSDSGLKFMPIEQNISFYQVQGESNGQCRNFWTGIYILVEQQTTANDGDMVSRTCR